jgi:transposase
LAPTPQPDDIVIADRLASHKVAGAREAIDSRGACLMRLPPYSHDLNPIEQAFAGLEILSRKAARAYERGSGAPSETPSQSSAQTSACRRIPRMSGRPVKFVR